MARLWRDAWIFARPRRDDRFFSAFEDVMPGSATIALITECQGDPLIVIFALEHQAVPERSDDVRLDPEMAMPATCGP